MGRRGGGGDGGARARVPGPFLAPRGFGARAAACLHARLDDGELLLLLHYCIMQAISISPSSWFVSMLLAPDALLYVVLIVFDSDRKISVWPAGMLPLRSRP